MSLGTKRLVYEAARRGLSERKLASLLGCSPSAAHRYLAGLRTPEGRVLVAIERELGIPPAEFFA